MQRTRRKISPLGLFGSRPDATALAGTRFAAWLVAIVMALSGGVAASPVWAAPVVQTADATLAGTYQSEVLPAPDSTGLVVSLTLNEDGSAELMSDYLNDEAPIIEVGQWVQNEDGTMTLTVTGTADQDYSLPIELVFQVNEAGALVIPGEANGPFGEAGLNLAPTELPVAIPVEEAPDDALDLSTLPDNARVYQSEVLPSASTSGLQITLILFADGTLEMVSDYQDPGQIVLELGTWAAADDGTVIVTLTGQPNRNYEAAVELAFTTSDSGALALVDEDGLLFGEDGLTLTPLVMPADTEAATEDATEDGEAAAEATPDAEAEAEATVEATDAFTVEVTPEVEATPTVTDVVTPTEESPDETAPAADDSAADETTDDEAADDEEADDQAADDQAMDDAMLLGAPDGPFVSDLLPAADASGFFQVALFYPNGDVLLSSYFLNGEPPVLEIGQWAAADMLTEPAVITDTETVTDTTGITDTATVTDTTAMTETSPMTAASPTTYTVTLTGTVDEPYENPVIIQMVAQADGAVELDGVMLHPLTTAKLDTMTPVTIAQFESDVLPAASGPGLQIRLTLYDDASLEMVSDFQEPGEVVSETGEWLIDDAGNLVVTLTGQNDQAYEEPVTLRFAIGEDDTLTLVDDEGLFGDEGLTLLSVPVDPDAMDPLDETEAMDADEAADSAESDAAPAEPLPAQLGLYQSEVLPAASSPGLQVSVALLEDNAVAMDYDYLDDGEVVTFVGDWQDNGDGTVTLTLAEGPGGAFEEPVVLTLAVGEAGMTIVEADGDNADLVDVELVFLPLE